MKKMAIILLILFSSVCCEMAGALDEQQITNSLTQFKAMDIRELVQWMGDEKWGERASSAVHDRIYLSEKDQDSEAAQALVEAWKHAMEEKARLDRLEKNCIGLLWILQHPALVAFYTNQLLNGETQSERCSSATRLKSMAHLGHGKVTPALASAVPALEEAIREAERRREEKRRIVWEKSKQRVLFDEDPVERQAMWALGALGSAAVPALQRLWESGWQDDYMMGAMSDTKDKRFLPMYLEVLENTKSGEYTRRVAVEHLGELGDESVLPTLRKYREGSEKGYELFHETVAKAIEDIEKRLAEKEDAGAATNQPAVPPAGPPLPE